MSRIAATAQPMLIPMMAGVGNEVLGSAAVVEPGRWPEVVWLLVRGNDASLARMVMISVLVWVTGGFRVTSTVEVANTVVLAFNALRGSASRPARPRGK
jgi:hypothetical protein